MGRFGGRPFDRELQDDPEMEKLLREDYDLERQTYDAAKRVKRGQSTDEKDKSRKELAEIVGKHFEVRQRRRDLQVKRMEDEIKKLRDVMTKRGEAKEQIIKKRLSELLGDGDDLQF